MNSTLFHHACLLASILLVLGVWFRTRRSGTWRKGRGMTLMRVGAMVAFDLSLPSATPMGLMLLTNFVLLMLLGFALNQAAAPVHKQARA